MLTDEKRKKLLAGALAVVMLTGVAGCGNDKDSEWKNDNSAQNNQDEKKDEDNGGGFFHGFFPWYFIGRTFGVGPMAGVRTAPAANQKQNAAPAGSSTILNQTLTPPMALLYNRELQEARKVPSSAVRALQVKAVSAVA